MGSHQSLPRVKGQKTMRNSVWWWTLALMLIVAAASISAYDSFEDDSLTLDADYLNDILNPSRISRAAGWKLRAGKRAALWKLRTGKRSVYAVPDDVMKRDALWKLRTGKRA